MIMKPRRERLWISVWQKDVVVGMRMEVCGTVAMALQIVVIVHSGPTFTGNPVDAYYWRSWVAGWSVDVGGGATVECWTSAT